MKTTTYNDLNELARRAVQAAGVVKLACGLVNNATWVVLMNAHDEARKMPNYRHQTKQAFKHVFELWREYENNLLYARANRMFSVGDMDEPTRRKYGEHLTDAEYFDFWKGFGYTAYERTKKWLTSLQNKYRLSLVAHDVRHADKVAALLTAEACLAICEDTWQKAVENAEKSHGLPRKVAEGIFAGFNVKNVAQAWKKALSLISPDSDYVLGEIEERNIAQGVSQLYDAWTDMGEAIDSVRETVPEYEEVFRTKGMAKKAARELKELRDNM